MYHYMFWLPKPHHLEDFHELYVAYNINDTNMFRYFREVVRKAGKAWSSTHYNSSFKLSASELGSTPGISKVMFFFMTQGTEFSLAYCELHSL
jgi:hypothetical protein